MRKKLCLLLVLIALFTCFSTTSFAYSDETVSLVEVDQSISNIENEEYEIRYFPFVYRDDEGFSWFRENIVQTSDCELGYLYVKDLMTGEIWKLLDFEVDFIRENANKIYCVVNGKELGVTDYSGSTYETVYCAEELITFVELYNEIVYVVIGSKVVRIDTETEQIETISVSEDIKFFMPVEENAFLWSDNEEETYLIEDCDVSQQRLVDEEELNTQYLATEIIAPEDVDSFSPLAATVNQPTLPLNAYPTGSYFTYNGEACDHHGTDSCSYFGDCNCRAYASSIQCMGFAKYAIRKSSLPLRIP